MSDRRRVVSPGPPAHRAGARVALACWLLLALAPVRFVEAQQPPLPSIQLPPVIVTAQKEPADAQGLPVSVTAVPQATLASAGVSIVSDAAVYAPNIRFTEFSARKLSNARVRGIGASPANPAITTYLDGVPQLHANSSSLELIDVDQIEFVRGPQSALFGRNTLGGLINVTSVRPSLERWGGTMSVPLGNLGARDIRGSASGPLVNGRLAAGVALQYGRRDGFTTNVLTGNDLDTRSAFSAKGQLLWTPAPAWEARLVVTGERARDGDYALTDLASLRANPFQTARDFEGHTFRDVLATTVLARREGVRLAFSTTTGLVRWRTEDATDLDYTPLPLATRENVEESLQVTQEVRLASAAHAPVRLSERVSLRWQTGAFVFTQRYDQDAVNRFAPFVLVPTLGIEVSQHAPQAALDDIGGGLYAHGTATVGARLDLTAGVRVDHERKDATLRTFFAPAVAPSQDVVTDASFSNVSPQAAVAFRVRPDKTVYVSAAQGFKAGGFNAAAPAGSDVYGEEHTRSVEAGAKTSWAGGRTWVNAAAFRIDWDDLQLNVPDPMVPGQFFIANVGGAASSGVEVELSARVRPGVDVFTVVGYTHARFKEGSVSGGVPVGGRTIPHTPDYTATVGTQISHGLRAGASLYARAEATMSGAFYYDEANTAEQDRYALANFRVGARGRYVFTEIWVRNAFDTRYIPVAFPYSPFAPSGFVGEMGRPRTFGLNAGVAF